VIDIGTLSHPRKIPTSADAPSKKMPTTKRTAAIVRLRCQVLSVVAKAFAEEPHAVFDVAEAFVLRAYLAFDTQRAAIADLLQRFYELFRARLPATERHLFSPGSLCRGTVGVLDMNAADVRREQLHGLQRVVLVVEQHVRGVEVHLQVRTL